MNEQLLPLAVWLQVAYGSVGHRLRTAWTERRADDGIDEAVTKMIWLRWASSWHGGDSVLHVHIRDGEEQRARPRRLDHPRGPTTPRT